MFSLCSDQDPSGLLLLPPKGAPSDFDISPILSVMETLLLVATREVRPLTNTPCIYHGLVVARCTNVPLCSPFPQCEVMMVDENSGASRTVLLSLFWALQGSLLSWCYLQLKGGASTAISKELARDILLKCEILRNV